MRFFAIVLISACMLITGCGRKASINSAGDSADQGSRKRQGFAKKDRPDEAVSPELLKQRVLAFNLEGLTDRGEKKWDVTGKSAESMTEDRIKLNDIVAKSYGAGNEATIVGDIGIYDKGKNNITLQENVKATIENTEGFSKEFLGNLPGEAANRSGSKKDETGRKTKTVITCDGDAMFDYEKNQAYFDRNVKVVSDDGNIDADRITVNLDVVTKKVKDIIAEGHVKIVRGENISYSDKATYIEPERKIILTGQPKLVIREEKEFKENLLGGFGGAKKP